MTATTLQIGIFTVAAILTLVILVVGTKLKLRWISYEGRFRRKLFIPIFFVSIILAGFGYKAIYDAMAANNWMLILIMILAFAIFLSVMVASSMKRLQDIGFPGWYYIAYLIIFTALSDFIPQTNIIGYAVAAFLLVWRGETQDNKYGPNPRVQK